MKIRELKDSKEPRSGYSWGHLFEALNPETGKVERFCLESFRGDRNSEFLDWEVVKETLDPDFSQPIKVTLGDQEFAITITRDIPVAGVEQKLLFHVSAAGFGGNVWDLGSDFKNEQELDRSIGACLIYLLTRRNA